MAVNIAEVRITPNPVNVSNSFKLEVTAFQTTWDYLKQNYTWDSLKSSGQTWNSLKNN